MDQIRRMQVAARGGGEYARNGTLAQTISPLANGCTCQLTAGVATSPRTCCLATSLWSSGCDAGPLFFFETAQQVLFAQQLLLHASWLGAFDRMHDAAGSRNGMINIASATGSRIAALLRIS